MAATPEPSDPEDSKLELPSLGGLLGRRKKDAAPVEVEQDPPTEVEEQPVDRGPDLVAPATAYAEAEPGEPDQPVRTRRRPSLPARPSMPSLSRPSMPTLSLPILEDHVAAPLTGAVVGLAGVVLVYLVRSGCNAVRGASSCGGAGLPLLLVVLILMILAGAALLRAWLVEEPTTTSFLAVALLAVVSMLFLLPVIDRWFMLIVAPVLSAALFLLSWWVTSHFDAPEREAARERANAR